MRPYWKGYLKLALVSCPIALHAACSTAERIALRQVNKATGNRLRQQLVDEETGTPVAVQDRGRGYEVGRGEYLIVSEEELDAIEIESTHTIEIDSFVPRSEIDQRFLDSPYYVIPSEPVGQEAFAVIREAMRGNGMVALGRFVLCKRERVIALEPYDKGLLGTTLRYADEVRNAEDYFCGLPELTLVPDMLTLAGQIVESKVTTFDPLTFRDRYAEDLLRQEWRPEGSRSEMSRSGSLCGARSSNAGRVIPDALYCRAFMSLKEPTNFIWDDRLTQADKKLVGDLNASLVHLSGLRAVEINVSGKFARSKIAWKLATYQHVLLHRLVALMDGAAVAWNSRCTLSAMLSARAFMETFAVMAELERRVTCLLKEEDLGSLDALAQNGIFSSRDEDWIKENPETAAVSVLTYIDKFDKRAEGFRGHYDMLSERCHPNSLGHNFMFSKLDRSDGTVRFCDEREPTRNGQMILAALAPLPLAESISGRLDELIDKVSDLHHRVAPVSGAAREPRSS